MEFEQRVPAIAVSDQPYKRTCWPAYNSYNFGQLQREYRSLAAELAGEYLDSLDIGTAKLKLSLEGENPTEQSAHNRALLIKESRLNCIGLRLMYHLLLATDSIQWFG